MGQYDIIKHVNRHFKLSNYDWRQITMKTRTHLPSWHRLDNAANVFPLISHKNFSNVFRLAVEMKTSVNPQLLQKALDITLPYFGNFNFKIRSGFFWYYFEPTNTRLLIQKESLRPCAYVDTKMKHHHLFRILYYKNRISLEVFHAITDGTGAMHFLTELTVNYLKLVSGESLPEVGPRRKIKSELEDSYKKYYKKMKHTKKHIPRAFKFKGKRLPINTLGVLHGFLDVDAVIDYSRSIDVTLTEYIASTYLWAIYSTSLDDDKKKRPIHLAVPINLRRFFESKSNMNFFSHITVAIEKSSVPLTFELILASVKEQFRTQITKENMLENISKEVALSRNPLTRIVPLLLKNIFVKIIHLKTIQSYTTTLSNVGKIEMPEKWANDVAHFELVMNATSVDPMKCTICTYQNKMVVTISSQLEDTRIQSAFFRKLASDGLNVTIESNGAYYEIL